jgi:hypothetical protein
LQLDADNVWWEIAWPQVGGIKVGEEDGSVIGDEEGTGGIICTDWATPWCETRMRTALSAE